MVEYYEFVVVAVEAFVDLVASERVAGQAVDTYYTDYSSLAVVAVASFVAADLVAFHTFVVVDEKDTSFDLEASLDIVEVDNQDVVAAAVVASWVDLDNVVVDNNFVVGAD